MNLNSNSFVTLEEYRIFADIPDTDVGRTAVSGSTVFLNAAADFIENQTSRTFYSGSLAEEEFDGRGYNQIYDFVHNQYYTKQAPITSTPVIYCYSNSSWTIITATIGYNAVNGIVYLRGGNSYFENGHNNYRVDYYYGYDGSSAIPYDLKVAQMIYAKHLQMNAVNLGVSQTGGNDAKSKTYSLNKIPLFVTQTINKYTRSNK